jgi:hypothetical protein
VAPTGAAFGALTQESGVFYPKPEKAPKRRSGHKDPVPRWVRDEVLHRDGRCFMERIDRTHVCRDQWGTAHSSRDVQRLTLEHVKKELRFGVRAGSSKETMVALCHAENLRPPSKETREAMRAYLATLYPAAWPPPP